MSLFGCIPSSGRVVPLEEMDKAIADAATESFSIVEEENSQ